MKSQVTATALRTRIQRALKAKQQILRKRRTSHWYVVDKGSNSVVLICDTLGDMARQLDLLEAWEEPEEEEPTS